MKQIIIILMILPHIIVSCHKEKSALPASSNNKHDLNETTKTPGRIISLTPAITEVIYLLDADNMLLANTNYCNRPVDAQSKKKIGNLKLFDIEKIISLKPDIVLSTSLANNNKIDKLKQLGIRVKEFPAARSFTEICSNFLELGIIINRKEKANEIVNRVKKQVEHIRGITKSLQKKRVFMQIGAKPLVTVNKDFFIHDYIVFSGGINIAENSKTYLYSRESVLQSNPDVIIITNMGIIGEEEKEAWRKYKTINAIINNDIHIVNSDIFCIPTPVTFLKSLKITVSLLHPEIKIKDNI